MSKFKATGVVLLVAAALATSGCGKKKDGLSANLPMVTPPVKSATPAGLQSGSSLYLTLATSDFKSRFFNAAGGPSNIFNILSAIDDRINGINEQTKSKKSACVSQTPVAYTISLVGKDVTFYAQCSQSVGGGAGNTGLVLFGTNANVTYLYTAIGAGNVAVIATPVSGTTDKYTIQAWLSVGYGTTTGSYGFMELAANSATNSFEFAVAGRGLGYCGAQLRSDGTNIFATGSADGPGCAAVDTLCVQASDASTAATCGTGLTTFSLPPLGRLASTGGSQAAPASLYPSTPTINLDGTAGDAVHFGPQSAPAGVGSL